MSARATIMKTLIPALMAVLALCLFPAAALAVDDYPSKYKDVPKDSVIDEWRFYNRNCVSFVAWRLNSANGVDFTCYYLDPQGDESLKWGNANTWAAVARRHGIAVNSTPAPGAVAWWNSGSYGHVAWVESVDGDQVTLEEYNYDYRGNYNRRTVDASSVDAFIHIADLAAGGGLGTASGVEDGPADIGWEKRDGTWYYLDADGNDKTGWVKADGTWYYLDPATGAMLTGWQKVKGAWYYLKKSGAMKTGWLHDNGKWYYLASSGAMKTGWVKVDSTWYYLSGSGAMRTGWVKLSDSWYHLSGSGAMATGWRLVDGSWYWFYSSGRMAYSRYVDGYWLTESGRMA